MSRIIRNELFFPAYITFLDLELDIVPAQLFSTTSKMMMTVDRVCSGEGDPDSIDELVQLESIGNGDKNDDGDRNHCLEDVNGNKVNYIEYLK